MSNMSRENKVFKVALDTNVLLMIADGVRVFDHIEEELETRPEYLVITPVLDELKKLATTGSIALSRKASLALRAVELYCKVVDYPLHPGEKVDDALVRFASETGAIVATNDKELRAKLRERGLSEIYLREESMRMRFEGPGF